MSAGRRAGTKVSSLTLVAEHPWPIASLPTAVRATFLESAIERRFASGDILYLAGSPAHSLYLVLGGRVRLLREHQGRTVYIHDEGPGGALGEVPLFEGTTYPATAIASEPTRCLIVSRTAVLAAVRASPDFTCALLARLAGRVRLLVERLDRQTGQPTLARLAEHVRTRAASSPGPSFTLGGTQQQVAEEIGTVRELVVRGLRTLRDREVIEARGGGRYVITDGARLQEIALLSS
ncbi:MAG: Crp/Fnr family transcriptional regulator [bacterium]